MTPFKNADVNLNISTKGSSKVNSSTRIVFSSQDKGTARFQFNIKNNGNIMPLNDVEGEIVLLMTGDSKFVDTARVVDAEKGIMEYILTDEQLTHFGNVFAELNLKYKDGSKIGGLEWDFSIERSKLDQVIEPSKEYYVATFEELEKDIHDRATAIEEVIDQLEDGVTESVVVQVETAKTDSTGQAHANIDSRIKAEVGKIETKQGDFTAALAEISQQVGNGGELNKHFLVPQYIEYFGSFSRFGLGVPSGLSKYTGGNYVLTVSGNAGDTFVTVESGTIADAGGRWPCVIENNDGIFDLNQVVSIDGAKINLLEPLKKSISSKRLGNLHDADQGQHYTELGYFAFAQHLYSMNPRHTERNQYIAQFKPDDTTGNWASNAWFGYAQSHNMKHANGYYRKIGGISAFMNATNNTHYVEWEQRLDKEKGYFESYIGASDGALIIEFYKDGALAEVKNLTATTNRIIFNYENVNVAKVRIKATGTQGVYIGLTTWWKNEQFQKDKLIDPNDKVVYIGDSWGEFHNKATTRELKRLMTADGGNPTVLDYSKGGHTTDYAKAWFQQYVIDNKPNKVIIEYFTNDFNSIGGTNVGTFLAPDGTQKDMSIAGLNEYINNIIEMVNLAIENNIQPIIIMPASTNSESQTAKSSNYAVQLWLGKGLNNENPSFKTLATNKAITNLVESLASATTGEGVLRLLSKEINSSVRKGVISDSNVNLTNGDIHGYYNNGIRKAGIRHDGTIDAKQVKLQIATNRFLVPEGEEGRGILYLVDASVSYGGEDEFIVVKKQADGTYKRKKLQLTDIV